MKDTPVERAFDYLWNADPREGRVSVEQFDDDHDPIGPQLRGGLLLNGWVYFDSRTTIRANRPPRDCWIADDDRLFYGRNRVAKSQF